MLRFRVWVVGLVYLNPSCLGSPNVRFFGLNLAEERSVECSVLREPR